MRIAIVGAGAMGQLFGAHLGAAGHDTVLIDVSAEAVAAIDAHGIAVRTGDGGGFRAQVRAALAPEIAGAVELVMVFTKTMHSEAALDSVAHLIDDGTLVLSLQNGLGNERPIVDRVGADRAFIGTTDYPADRQPEGGIATSAEGKIVIGGLGAAGSDRAAELAEVFAAAGMRALHHERVYEAVWEKAIFNAVLNTLTAATGLTVGATGRELPALRLVDDVLAETFAVAAARGVAVDEARVRAAVRNAQQSHGEHRTSMLVDLEAGRATEIEAIGGAISRIGVEVGVPTPVLSTLCDIVRLREAALQRTA
ncbi:2-dehydropantoate 2-reductase [Leucobacter sp. gxy201]|uniref:ketopantoate reductase family protein n=1 Tax=Leucobacter sp. gxy201 TaxID=2957200 RepID=UPI003DA051FB